MTMHQLKTLDTYWDAVFDGSKTFEVRKNDRAFQAGDEMLLMRIDKQGTLCHNAAGILAMRYEITYVLMGGQFGIEPLYCVLGMKPLDDKI